MIKLANQQNWCVWISGKTATEYKQQAMEATGRSRMCPSVIRAMATLADKSLHTALSCGCNILISYDDADGNEIKLKKPLILPAPHYEAMLLLKEKYNF